MLNKIHKFNDLVDLIVLQEGYFHVPQKVYRHIIRDYYDILRVVKSQKIKRMTRQSFPVKVYELDFSGTNFEFLNHLNPNSEFFHTHPDWTPSIKVRYTSSGGSWYNNSPRSFGEESKEDRALNRVGMGFIQIDLSDDIREVVDVIEHEILHYVQYLIQRRKRLLDIGGLPTKKIIDDRYTSGGYKKGSKRMKRTKHSHRPMEYYPDLLSAIRQMEFTFSRYYPDYEYDWRKPTKWEKQKKQFFLGVLNGFPVSIATHVFKEFKKVSKEFYNHMVKVGYDAFVNKPPNLDMSEIRRIGSELGLDVSDLPQANLEVINNPPQPEPEPEDDSEEYKFKQIKTTDRKMFEDSLGKDIQGLHYFDYYRRESDDPNEFSYPNMLQFLFKVRIPYRTKREYVKLPNNWSTTTEKIKIIFPIEQFRIEKMFTELKQFKDLNEDIFSDYGYDNDKVGRLKEEDRQKAYQSVYNYLVNMYLKKGKPNEYTKKVFLEFLEKLNF